MATVFTPNQATLVNDASVYRTGIINAHTRKALLAYAKALFLKSFGGATDYTANWPLLFSDAAVANKGSSPDAIQAARVAMEFTRTENGIQNANSAVAVPATLAAKLAAIAPLLAQPDPILDQVILYLECACAVQLYNQ